MPPIPSSGVGSCARTGMFAGAIGRLVGLTRRRATRNSSSRNRAAQPTPIWRLRCAHEFVDSADHAEVFEFFLSALLSIWLTGDKSDQHGLPSLSPSESLQRRRVCQTSRRSHLISVQHVLKAVDVLPRRKFSSNDGMWRRTSPGRLVKRVAQLISPGPRGRAVVRCPAAVIGERYEEARRMRAK